MPRTLTNISGERRSLQDHTGRWHIVEPDGVYVAADVDLREFPPDTWQDITPAPSKTKKTHTEEAS